MPAEYLVFPYFYMIASIKNYILKSLHSKTEILTQKVEL